MYLLDESETRQNLRALAKFGVLLASTVALFTVLFHAIMVYEGQTEHSWLTGFYWTLTVMSTLGFGDITFHSDLGRFFTIVVLVYGIVMLLIVAPFAHEDSKHAEANPAPTDRQPWRDRHSHPPSPSAKASSALKRCKA